MDLAEAAHCFAGSAGMFGFERAAAVARHFERAVQADAPEAPILAEVLTAAVEALLDVLMQRAGVTSRMGAAQEACS